MQVAPRGEGASLSNGAAADVGRPPIFVLRRSFAELQHCVLSVARSAGRLGIPVYATRMRRREPAVASKFVAGSLELPASASDARWLDALREFDCGHPSPVLLPIDDVAALFVESHHQQLSERFTLLSDSRGLHRRLASKRELWDLCQRLGVPTPESRFPPSESEAAAIAEEWGYPIVLKRVEPGADSDGAALPSVLIARTSAELISGYRRLESPLGPQVMLQDYIPGGSDSIWMFNGYFDRDAECRCAFTARKLRQRGPHTGPTTLGVCAWNETVADAAKLLMRELGYHGIVDMGFRFDARDGEYKLLDVNPRIGSSFRLFVGEDGLDVVRAMYLDLTGQAIPPSRARDGRKWLVEPYDVIASMQLANENSLTFGSWARSLPGVQETAWWARDDPIPFLAMSASLAGAGRRFESRRRRARAEKLEQYFDSEADYWRDVYGDQGLQGAVYRERMDAARRWIAELDLPAGAAVLDVGCGAGLLTAELARSGLDVTGTDSSAEMVARARHQAEQAGVAGRASVIAADVRTLPFETGRFDVVVALGLLPWLSEAPEAVAEMARVLREGGWLIVSADNRARLNLLSEPRENPLLAPVKLARRAARRAIRTPPTGAPSYRHLPGEVDRMLAAAGLGVARRTTIGFGPFTFLGRPIFDDRAAHRLHVRLQSAGERRAPALRRLGWHYLVAARKPANPIASSIPGSTSS